MKKYLFLFLMFCYACVQAQNKTLAAGLKIGDKVPDVLFNIKNYPNPTAKISNFKGKLLILDFWATWCSPCVAMIPVMDSLQKQFDGRVQFLPIAYQAAAVVEDFKEKLQQQQRPSGSLPEVVDDKDLGKLFPHTYLPHYVWIDANGIVKAVTGHEEVTAQNIVKILNTSVIPIPEKRDATPLTYSNRLPLFVNGNGGNGGNLLYHSVLTSCTPGLPAGVAELPADSVTGLKITLRNINLLWLYQAAYGEKKEFYPKNRIKLMVHDPEKISCNLKGRLYLDWLSKGNGYCYELAVPFSLAGNAYSIMQHDLSLLFPQYEAKVEKQQVDCLILVRTTGSNNLTSTGEKQVAISDAAGFQFKNQPLSSLVFQLNVFYMQLSPYPVIDETGYKGNVDLDLKANPSDTASMNLALKKYGLQLIRASRKIKVIAIRDTDTKQTHSSAQTLNQIK